MFLTAMMLAIHVTKHIRENELKYLLLLAKGTEYRLELGKTCGRQWNKRCDVPDFFN